MLIKLIHNNVKKIVTKYYKRKNKIRNVYNNKILLMEIKIKIVIIVVKIWELIEIRERLMMQMSKKYKLGALIFLQEKIFTFYLQKITQKMKNQTLFNIN